MLNQYDTISQNLLKLGNEWHLQVVVSVGLAVTIYGLFDTEYYNLWDYNSIPRRIELIGYLDKLWLELGFSVYFGLCCLSRYLKTKTQHLSFTAFFADKAKIHLRSNKIAKMQNSRNAEI